MSARPVPDPADPKGLIREAFAIEGISGAECRSILIDWALSLPPGATPGAAIPVLLDRHGSMPDHPMIAVLRAGLAPVDASRRRGGWRGRRT